MNIYLLPLLAVLLGSFAVVFFSEKDIQRSSQLTLAFSGAFLLSITVFDLLPDVFIDNYLKSKYDTKLIGLMIMLGILFQVILEFFSKGAEHGHTQKKDNNFPVVLLASLCLHAFIEGFSIELNNNILYGIFVHKIPIAFIITVSLLNSKVTKYKIILFILIFSIMTPLGTYISNNNDIIQIISNLVNSFVIGLLLHVSTTILFESSEGHKFNIVKITLISFAILLAYFI